MPDCRFNTVPGNFLKTALSIYFFFQLVAYENYFPMQSNGLWPSDETIERLGEAMFQKTLIKCIEISIDFAS